jgi:phosphatidylglycerol:prolipoprotein diacylglycerol transferase
MICAAAGLGAVGLTIGLSEKLGISLTGPYVHHIDPILGTVLGVHLWWYGLSYTLGFLNAYFYLRRHRTELGFSMRSVYNLSFLLAVGVLIGGRAVEVIFYEWPFYQAHPWLVPAYWLGGMATHGLLLGGLAGVWMFCRLERKPFLSVTDALAMPAAVIMGLGRIGNFIDGQIVGSVSTAWWAVKFPDADGFRHPVVLYDGLKNLLLVPVLLYADKRHLPSGVKTGLFLFLYAFLRIFVDVFREYPTSLMGLATGQVLNIGMSVLGLGLMVARFWKPGEPAAVATSGESRPVSTGMWRRVALAVILLGSMVMPSDSTQDVPARYGNRHAGLKYSALYPKIFAKIPDSSLVTETEKR